MQSALIWGNATGPTGNANASSLSQGQLAKKVSSSSLYTVVVFSIMVNYMYVCVIVSCPNDCSGHGECLSMEALAHRVGIAYIHIYIHTVPLIKVLF